MSEEEVQETQQRSPKKLRTIEPNFNPSPSTNYYPQNQSYGTIVI